MLERIKAITELEKVEKHDLVGSIFDLTPTEAQAYFAILGENTISVSELSEKIQRDRTTSQRILLNLVEKQLAERVKINLAKGGIKYRYDAVPFSITKQKMIERIESFNSAVVNHIRSI